MDNKIIYPGSYYQPLFDLLHNEHGITPLESEMADIVDVVKKMLTATPGMPALTEPILNDEDVKVFAEMKAEERQQAEVKPRGDKAMEIAEELWDRHSVLIGEDIFTLEQYANQEVMKKGDFFKAVDQLFQQRKK